MGNQQLLCGKVEISVNRSYHSALARGHENSAACSLTALIVIVRGNLLLNFSDPGRSLNGVRHDKQSGEKQAGVAGEESLENRLCLGQINIFTCNVGNLSFGIGLGISL